MSADESEVTSDAEKQARQMGWVPREDWKGPEEQWIDAEAFVKKGDEVVPFIRANNKRLLDKLGEKDRQISDMQTKLDEMFGTVESLKQVAVKEALAEGKARRDAAKKKLADALEADDHDAAAEATAELVEQPAVEEPPKKANGKDADSKPDPAFQAWVADNPWFTEDDEAGAIAMAVGASMRKKGNTTTGRPFLDAVGKRTQEYLNAMASLGEGAGERRVSKVEGGGRPSSSSTGDGTGRRGKTFADLPKEDQQACDSFIGKLVGKGKAYETTEAWRKAYVADYDWSA